jgi:putative nucleotidyltransferase with HDIG domain
VTRTIRLRGTSGAVRGRSWNGSGLLRIGRLAPDEVILDHPSVSRHHAEVRATDGGWRVRDLGSTNGTRLNGAPLGTREAPLRARDLLQVGDVSLVVEELEDGDATARAMPVAPAERVAPPPAAPSGKLSGELHVEATTRSSWDQALEGLAYDTRHCLRAGDQLVALLRAGHHLGHIEDEAELLRSILEDAVAVLDAQRGAIVLAEGPENRLRVRAVVTGRGSPRERAGRRPGPGGRFHFSQRLASRCFEGGESVLCHRAEDDPELAVARSIIEGTMSSAVCVPLRTPRNRLGVLHLDRGPWQKPFTRDDLRLADGLSASVSAGIEAARLLRKQRDRFLDTIALLAQAVEMKDEYTGGHTQRVSAYALLLAEELRMPAADVDLVRLGTPLHDIGKIGIDDAILRKPGRLTAEEFAVMKTHTVKGAEMIATVPDLHPVLPIVRSHHERWDGGGYPDGLGGEAVSPLARVVALADAFDAMTSNRPYRRGMPTAVAFAEIEKQAGRQFDPRFAAAFLAARGNVEAAMQRLSAAPPGSRRVPVLAATVT